MYHSVQPQITMYIVHAAKRPGCNVGWILEFQVSYKAADNALLQSVTQYHNAGQYFLKLQHLRVGLLTMVHDPKVSNHKLDGYEIDCGMMSEDGPL